MSMHLNARVEGCADVTEPVTVILGSSYRAHDSLMPYKTAVETSDYLYVDLALPDAERAHVIGAVLRFQRPADVDGLMNFLEGIRQMLQVELTADDLAGYDPPAAAADVDQPAEADRPAGTCQRRRAGCPEHGDYVHTVPDGSRSLCVHGACRHRWDYPRPGRACDQPSAYRVTDPEGNVTDICAGHAFSMPVDHSWSVEPLGSTP